MTKLAEKIKSLVETEAGAHGAFVVGQSSGEKGLYRYYIDAETVLTMNTLAEITRNVSKQIDEMDTGTEAFTFEISSPGADSPLSDLRQFAKHAGRNFELETPEGAIEGKLMAVENRNLTFEKTTIAKINGKKQTLVETIELPYEHIKKATIKISFK